MKAAIALIALLIGCTPDARKPIVDSMTIAKWGEVADGLQLSITAGVNTDSLTGTASLLYLTVNMRNVSATPVSVDFDQATYDFEYEIDGTWYAFERLAPVRTPLSVMHADLNYSAVRSMTETIAPGSQRWTMLTPPLAGRSRALQLFAVASGGLGRQFEPTPGAHVVRVRPGRALDVNRQAPVSNAVTVSLRTPTHIERRIQSVSFASSRVTPLRELRFVSGPADGQALIREVLSRPPHPASATRLITSAALEVLEPIQVYELWLTRRADTPNTSSPTPTSRYYYLVRASDQVVGSIELDAYAPGSLLHFVHTAANADPVLSALQQLARMEQVRGGNYEPRLVHVIGVRGALPLMVLWLYSTSGRPDLFYRPRDPDSRGSSKVQSEKLYSSEAFLAAARTLPVAPRHNVAWAITTATVCAKAAGKIVANPLIYEQATAEIGLDRPSDQGDRIGWYVYFPERTQVRIKHSGATFFVDDMSGACRLVPQN